MIPPETAHHLVLKYLSTIARLRSSSKVLNRGAEIEVMGLVFPNRVGLAAGLDKNGDCIDGLSRLGFGFIEIGTVTPRPQPGNPKPRLFRLPSARALINRLGFNNKGVDYLIEQVKQKQYNGILGINIGKNFDTPLDRAVEDYCIGLRKVYPYASYITINISSPNTPGLRNLQHEEELANLLGGIKKEQLKLVEQYQKKVPLVVKIAPDLSPEDVAGLANILINHQIDGVIATNTTIARQGVENLPHGAEVGGLSGKPLFHKTLAVVQQLHQSLAGKIPIIACGGIMSEQDAAAMFGAGASLIQIYSGFIYEGPELVKKLSES